MHSKSGPRRRHSVELKARVLAACNEPGASIAGVALAHGLNANLVRKWRCGRGTKRAGMAVVPAVASQAAPASVGAATEFVAIEMPALPKAQTRTAAEPTAAAPSTDAQIRIELRRGPLHLNVRWPIAAAEDCRAWLSELSSSLLK